MAASTGVEASTDESADAEVRGCDEAGGEDEADDEAEQFDCENGGSVADPEFLGAFCGGASR